MDDRDVAAKLLRLVAPDGGAAAVRLRFGKVTQASPLRVSLGGGPPVPVSCLAAYTPVEEDVVALLQQGKQFLALGPVVPPA